MELLFSLDDTVHCFPPKKGGKESDEADGRVVEWLDKGVPNVVLSLFKLNGKGGGGFFGRIVVDSNP